MHPDPTGEAYTTPPYPLAGYRDSTSKVGKGEKEKEKGKGGMTPQDFELATGLLPNELLLQLLSSGCLLLAKILKFWIACWLVAFVCLAIYLSVPAL